MSPGKGLAMEDLDSALDLFETIFVGGIIHNNLLCINVLKLSTKLNLCHITEQKYWYDSLLHKVFKASGTCKVALI